MLAGADARQQAFDLQAVGTDAVQRRERTHQHVIRALEIARLLYCGDVLRLFDDADGALVARGLVQKKQGSVSVMLLHTEQ